MSHSARSFWCLSASMGLLTLSLAMQGRTGGPIFWLALTAGLGCSARALHAQRIAARQRNDKTRSNQP